MKNIFLITTNEFLGYLKVEKGYSEKTIEAYRNDLNQFFSYINKKITSISSIDKEIISDYIATCKDKEYSLSTISRKIASIRSLFKYLYLEEQLKTNIAKNIRIKGRESKLPETISIEEINTIFDYLNKQNHPTAKRDIAIIEILYGCGIRISELVNLNISDIDNAESIIRCIGKGQKERLIPVNHSALTSINNYINIERFNINKKQNQALFLTNRGSRISRQTIWQIVKIIFQKNKMKYNYTPHTFRHTFATHILQGGASIRHVQEMLGHSSIATTQIYTHIDKTWMKKEYNKAHPRA